MEKIYKYGNEINYSELKIVKSEDRNKLQTFSCGNKSLDDYIRNEIFDNKEPQGLHFIIEDKNNGNVICFVSLATSGIIYRVGNYSHVLPSIKIDVFAMDEKYQKIHLYEESEKSNNAEEHCYFSDSIMADVIMHCRIVDENYAMVDYIMLYADKKAERFYLRNGFGYFGEYMEKEINMEINKNIPMYLAL